jgi:hypothetical protein
MAVVLLGDPADLRSSIRGACGAAHDNICIQFQHHVDHRNRCGVGHSGPEPGQYLA